MQATARILPLSKAIILITRLQGFWCSFNPLPHCFVLPIKLLILISEDIQKGRLGNKSVWIHKAGGNIFSNYFKAI